VIEDGKTRRIPIVREWLFTHLTKTALVVEDTSLSARPDKPRDARAGDRGSSKIGIDPHFAYALMLADVAGPETTGQDHSYAEVKDALVTDLAQRLNKHARLPKHIVAMIDQTPRHMWQVQRVRLKPRGVVFDARPDRATERRAARSMIRSR